MKGHLCVHQREIAIAILSLATGRS